MAPPQLTAQQPSHSLRPSFPGGDGEEGQQGPDDVVVVEFVALPLPTFHLHLVFLVIHIVASKTSTETRQSCFTVACGGEEVPGTPVMPVNKGQRTDGVRKEFY